MKYLVSVFLLVFMACEAFGCLWDRDTLWMENKKFPMALELIAGKFRRHSKYYYEWRQQEVLTMLRTNPKYLRLLDDLGVSYDKLGDHDKAIEIGLRALGLNQKRYKSLANLGTFYIHNGDYKEGLGYLKRAIKENPAAHFGRERYQVALVEYIMSFKKSKLELPMMTVSEGSWKYVESSFETYLLKTNAPKKKVTNISRRKLDKERQKAVKGILGMMYFGNYKSPVLLEALASLVYLLGSRSGFIGGQQIAARALLKASYEVKDEKIAGEYRHIANKFLSIQRLKGVRDNVEGEEKLLFIEKQFKKELADADTWFAEVEANEKMWLKNGEDLTKKYRETYAKSPRILQKK